MVDRTYNPRTDCPVIVTVWLIEDTILELSVLLMVTVQLTGHCNPRTVLLMVTVRLTGCSNPRTDCPVDDDCAVDSLMVTVQL